jgi:hypothetical protein
MVFKQTLGNFTSPGVNIVNVALPKSKDKNCYLNKLSVTCFGYICTSDIFFKNPVFGHMLSFGA